MSTPTDGPPASVGLGSTATAQPAFRFARTWRVTFRRLGWSSLVYLVLAIGLGIALWFAQPGRAFASFGFPQYSMGYYVGSFLGVAIGYMVLLGWWLDHVMGATSWLLSGLVQVLVAGVVATLGPGNPLREADSNIGFSPLYFGVYAVMATLVAQLLVSRLPGSFASSRQPAAGLPSGANANVS